MISLMCLQMLWLTKLLFTLRTVEWFLICMKSFKGLQITWWTEFLLTLWTAEWFFISMNLFICLEMLWLTELLFALWAAKSFFISMNYFMCLQMLWLPNSWCHENFRLHMRMWLKKVWNVTNNAVIKCVIRALSIGTSKNSVFPDFLIRLNRKSGFFFTITCLHASGLI